jgi:serine/threonine-protein kinase
MAPLSSQQWQVLSPLLDEALEMADEERLLWLSSLETENPALAIQLKTLLQEHQVLANERFLENGSIGSATPGLTGQTVGAYTLLSQTGQGGMGSVWLAERSDGRFERRVAVKLLHIALMGQGGEERFKREGRILARLSHPHIADLIDAGVSGAGQPYLVLEYIDGDHIDRYCDQQRLDIRSRIRLFLDVLQAVAKAHANLIVHRDLKPSNVLIRNDGQAKLLDFGIAKLIEDETPNWAHESGRALTPEYAAPEQLTGKAITTATDVYALGVLLYVLLTGQHPAGSARRAAADLVKAVVDTEPPRPSNIVTEAGDPELISQNAAQRATTPDRLSRALRGDLDTIVAKAMQKNPEDRYSSVTAFADDLRRYLQHEPISARPDTLSYRWIKFARRNQTAVALASLTIVASLAGVFGTLLQAHRARLQRDFALHQLARVESINDLDNFLLDDAAPWGRPFTVHELLAHAERLVERQGNLSPVNRVELLVSIGRRYESQDEDGKALPPLEQAYQISRGLSEPSPRAQASCALGSVLVHSDLPRAEALVQEGLRELPSEVQFTVDRASCLWNGSLVARERGDLHEAIARSQLAKRLLEESPIRSETAGLRALTELAESYGAADQYQDAVPIFERAFGRMRMLGRDDTENAGIVLNNWAFGLCMLGRPIEAERLFRQGMEISRAARGGQGISPVMLLNYARTLRELARFDEAAAYAQQAYARALKSNDQAIMNNSQLLRARIYTDQGNFARSQAVLSEVELKFRRQYPGNHFIFAVLAVESSRLAAARGDLQSALRLADQAVGITETWAKAGQGRAAYYLPFFLVLRSDVERRLGRANDAATDAARAVDLQAAKADALSSYRGRAFYTLGRALEAQGRLDDAHTAFRSAAEQLQATLGADHPDTRAALRQAESEPRAAVSH